MPPDLRRLGMRSLAVSSVQQWMRLRITEGAVGRGSFGRVRRAWVPIQGCDVEVAVKFANAGDDTADDVFLAEVDVWIGSQHPTICRVLGCDIMKRCFVMELAEASLYDMLYVTPNFEPRPGVAFDGTRRACVVFGVACALAWLASGDEVVHRDVKPSNILLDEDLLPRLADFGLAIAASSPRFRRYVGGTREYHPPEIRRGARNEWSSKVDVFALGWVILQVYGAEAPVFDEGLGYAPMPPLESVGMPRGVSRLAARCLALDPSARISALELVRELRDGAAFGNDIDRAFFERYERVATTGLSL